MCGGVFELWLIIDFNKSGTIKLRWDAESEKVIARGPKAGKSRKSAEHNKEITDKLLVKLKTKEPQKRENVTKYRY